MLVLLLFQYSVYYQFPGPLTSELRRSSVVTIALIRFVETAPVTSSPLSPPPPPPPPVFFVLFYLSFCFVLFYCCCCMLFCLKRYEHAVANWTYSHYKIPSPSHHFSALLYFLLLFRTFSTLQCKAVRRKK